MICLPAWGCFDIGIYAGYQKAVSEMQNLVVYDSANVRPELIPKSEPVKVPTCLVQSPSSTHWPRLHTLSRFSLRYKD